MAGDWRYCRSSWIPPRLRDPVFSKQGWAIGRVTHKARFRAQVNLAYGLPKIDTPQRKNIIDDMFAYVTQSSILMAELTRRDPNRVMARVRWHSDELIQRLQEEGRNVIFLVPHGWAVDVPAMLMAARGQKMTAIFHNQRNALVDYMWNLVWRRFGGRLHVGNDGIKPFISAVRQGYWGYYLPDQDHGAEHSEFFNFLPPIKRCCRLSAA